MKQLIIAAIIALLMTSCASKRCIGPDRAIGYGTPTKQVLKYYR